MLVVTALPLAESAALALEDIVLIRLRGLPPLLVTALLVQVVLVNLAALDKQAQHMAVAVAVAALTAQTTLLV
jgi:hypothetical protein